MRSPFRPDAVPDPAILDDHKPLIRSLERRGLIRGGLSLGALVMLTGCDVKRPEAVESALLAISRFNDERAGAAVRSEQAGADLSRLDDPAAAQVQRLLRRDGREAGERRRLAP